MFKTKSSNAKKSEDVKKSAGKVLDTKKDTPTRAKVNRVVNLIHCNLNISSAVITQCTAVSAQTRKCIPYKYYVYARNLSRCQKIDKPTALINHFLNRHDFPMDVPICV